MFKSEPNLLVQFWFIPQEPGYGSKGTTNMFVHLLRFSFIFSLGIMMRVASQNQIDESITFTIECVKLLHSNMDIDNFFINLKRLCH